MIKMPNNIPLNCGIQINGKADIGILLEYIDNNILTHSFLLQYSTHNLVVYANFNLNQRINYKDNTL